jgi:hypothetical protein
MVMGIYMVMRANENIQQMGFSGFPETQLILPGKKSISG